ncbi:MAG: hypothetical protein A2Y40_09230 [Candidatus Margulisbacteria bacterium GWF2_35_9]|nr:MAG: hypothetical protein A2Y40_09230 [Candidatus Margulisbacteria bacterium GWF2_35_9]
MKNKLLLIIIGLYTASTASALFDLNIKNPYEDAYYSEDGTSQKKIYLPPKDRIYRDENGEYFYGPLKVNDQKQESGGSGGFLVKYFQLNSNQLEAIDAQLALDSISSTAKKNMIQWGGGGYWHAGPNFYFGGSGAGGMVSSGTGSNRLKYMMGYGGIDFYILIPIGSPNFNLIAGSLIGVGGISMESKTINTYNKSFWVIEPKAGLQIIFSKSFAMRILASYMYSEDMDSEVKGTLANVDFDTKMALRNYCLSVVFDWGRF